MHDPHSHEEGGIAAEHHLDHRVTPRRYAPNRALVPIIVLAAILQGCASMAEGVTKAVLENRSSAENTLRCELTGPAFGGMASLYRATPAADAIQTLKVLMVHGIGSAKPGYSARLQTHLIQALHLEKVATTVKQITLRSQEPIPGPLGEVHVTRYLSKDEKRALEFYELTWSAITRIEKEAALAYDVSGNYRHRRAGVNQSIKEFVNSHAADPMMYRGTSRTAILEAASQAACWALSSTWSELPATSAQSCDRLNALRFFAPHTQRTPDTEFVFITHSLGSQVVVDMLQQEAERWRAFLDEAETNSDRQRLEHLNEGIRNYSARVYMLANQLPLLRLGREPPAIEGRWDAYCRPGGRSYNKRLFKELFIVAFSDPNDLLSYAIPPGFAENFMDSRLCAKIVNVSVNVTPTLNIFQIGSIADPVAAHVNYDADPRVIELMVNGTANATPEAEQPLQCRWLEAVDK